MSSSTKKATEERGEGEEGDRVRTCSIPLRSGDDSGGCGGGGGAVIQPKNYSSCGIINSETNDTPTTTIGHNTSDSTTKATTSRKVLHMDAIEWLTSSPDSAFKNAAIFTSIPDISELSISASVGKNNSVNILDYESWFEMASGLIFKRLEPGSYAIFLQSDVRIIDPEHRTVYWLDKGFLLQCAARRNNCRLVWKKVALIGTFETVAIKRCSDRPPYSNLMCFVKNSCSHSLMSSSDGNISSSSNRSNSNSGGSNDKSCVPVSSPFSSAAIEEPLTASELHYNSLFPRYATSIFSTPDVFERGDVVWAKGVGMDTVVTGISFIKTVAPSITTILDPFCGKGTILAAADYFKLNSIGVELSNKRCKQAMRLDLSKEINALSKGRLSMLGVSKDMFNEYSTAEKAIRPSVLKKMQIQSKNCLSNSFNFANSSSSSIGSSSDVGGGDDKNDGDKVNHVDNDVRGLCKEISSYSPLLVDGAVVGSDNNNDDNIHVGES